MKKYDFEYTKLIETIFFMIGICAFVCLLIYIFIALKFSLFWLYFVAPISGIGLFFLLRKIVIQNGEAEISDENVVLKLTNCDYTLDFKDLTFYKKTNYKNGPVLFLKNNTIKLRIEANNNFCDSNDFENFASALIRTIEINKKITS
jgi:hypothetical protein